MERETVFNSCNNPKARELYGFIKHKKEEIILKYACVYVRHKAVCVDAIWRKKN